MLWFIVALVCAGVGYAIGNGKGRGTEGALWGFFLGVIGLIIIAVRSPAQTLPPGGEPPQLG